MLTVNKILYIFISGYLFTVIYSLYDRRTGDRIWEAYCNEDFTRSSLSGYEWSSYQNKLYQDFQFTCKHNGVLAGIVGAYNNRDRQFSFLCAFFPNKKPKNCHSSYYTPLGKTWTRANPQDEYLTGIDSEYDHSTK